jgi:hypothetical protein
LFPTKYSGTEDIFSKNYSIIPQKVRKEERGEDVQDNIKERADVQKKLLGLFLIDGKPFLAAVLGGESIEIIYNLETVL